MKNIVALCKRRGIIYPSSEIYGGFANTWDYGPYGVLLKNNVKQAWWQDTVMKRADIVGLDSAILMNPKIWEASGHLTEFTDPLVECKKCHARFKADQASDKCLSCNAIELTPAKQFNLMFKTYVGPTGSEDDITYLRPETAQGIFVNFKNILDSTRVKLPFGVAQIGKAFRNEITPGNFTFRTFEFEQFELEYFVHPKDADQIFTKWRDDRLNWYVGLGINPDKLKLVDHPKTDLAHYAKAVSDVEYEFPFGWSELEGIANRGDYDLAQHQKMSGQNLEYIDEENNKILPYVIEPSGGVDRATLAFLVDAYAEEQVSRSAGQQVSETRTVLKLHPKLAPIKAAILPLVKRDPELVKIAKEIYEELKSHFFVEYDEDGTVGKRYRRQDEIGTPFCITVDSDSLTNKTVTIRHRDSMEQERIAIVDLLSWLKNKI
ncbi:glycine--tRNA ligase [Patescibacteria group bacterium]|nr:glycine--tRNA ligase [Patescibacteria group bacterium]